MPHKRAKAVGKLLLFDKKTTPRSIDRFGFNAPLWFNIIPHYDNRMRFIIYDHPYHCLVSIDSVFIGQVTKCHTCRLLMLNFYDRTVNKPFVSLTLTVKMSVVRCRHWFCSIMDVLVKRP